MTDGEFQVPVPKRSSQGLRGQLTIEARLLTEDPVHGSECVIAYLKDTNWWNITRPIDTVEDILDMIQPLLACESWDWHRAMTGHMLMKWAGLLSIVGLDESAAHTWQAEGSEYLCFLPITKTLEDTP